MSVDYFVNFIFSWKIFLFYSLLEGFRTSLQIFHIASYGILHFGSFSIKAYFQIFFLKTPTIDGWLDGRSCSCMLYIENQFKLEPWLGGSYMMYTLDHYCCFQLVSLDSFNWYQYWHSFCILIYMFFIYVCLLFI